MDHNTQGRRPHYHRGRRGSDRRGGDRRGPQQSPEQAGRASGDHVDVEQIMRDIRSRIAQRHGIELTTQQIQELAARRLEAILDPRTIDPSLVEQLRRGAAPPADVPLPAVEGGYAFEDTTLYETHRGLLRFIRRILNPILKLFFNPTPLVEALNTQARLNKEAAARETERERRQAEWNALHYEIVNRLVTEVSRVSVEVQALATRVESLAARVDFNDRRVRTIESAAPPPRQPHPRAAEVPVPAPAGLPSDTTAAAAPVLETPAAEGATRRKRRRRRGRRSGAGGVEPTAATGAASAAAGVTEAEGADIEEPEDEDTAESVVESESLADVAPPPAEPVVAPPPEDVVAPAPESTTPSPEHAAAPPEPTTPAPEHAAAPAAEDSRPGATEQPAPAERVQPSPPPDEPVPAAPVDRPDPGPPDR